MEVRVPFLVPAALLAGVTMTWLSVACCSGQLVLPAVNTYFYDGQHRLVYARSGVNMFNFTCTMWGDRHEIQLELSNPQPGATVERVGGAEMSSLIDMCNRHSANSSRPPSAKNIFTAIYPGTKWCGPGSLAESYEDLGPEVEADLCCRTHDYCMACLESGESGYDLTNSSPFTRCHCDCDTQFFACLKDAGTRTACSIGELFFNLVNVKCFKQEHPIVSCKQFGGLLNIKCLEYELDTSSPKLYQFFDTPLFQSKQYACSNTKGGVASVRR